MQKNITAKQHIVPKFYLKRFSNDKAFLSVLNLESNKLTKPLPYASVCYDKFYYAQETGIPDKVSQEFEEMFSKLESVISSKLHGIEKKILDYDHLSGDDRYLLSMLIAMLWIRGEYMRKQVRRMNEDMTKQIMSMRAHTPEFAKELEKISEREGLDCSREDISEMIELIKNKEYEVTYDNSSHLNFIGEIEGFTNLCFHKNWRIYIATQKAKFITSDNPTVEWFPKRKSFYGATFLNRKHYLALSPKILIELIYPASGKRLKRKALGDTKVFEFNKLIAQHSFNYCYALEEQDLIQIRDWHDLRVQAYWKHLIHNSTKNLP